MTQSHPGRSGFHDCKRVRSLEALDGLTRIDFADEELSVPCTTVIPLLVPDEIFATAHIKGPVTE